MFQLKENSTIQRCGVATVVQVLLHLQRSHGSYFTQSYLIYLTFRSNSSILGRRKKNQRKLRNKKRAHERRMSESENSETEEREKYKINQKNPKSSDTVKPILNKDKQSTKQKTANIEIKQGANDNNRSLMKRTSSVEEEIENEIHSDKQIESKEMVKAEFKNDLIFDLDM